MTHTITILTDSGNDTTITSWSAELCAKLALDAAKSIPDAIDLDCSIRADEAMARLLIARHGTEWMICSDRLWLALDEGTYSDRLTEALIMRVGESAAMRAEEEEAAANFVSDEEHFAQERWGMR